MSKKLLGCLLGVLLTGFMIIPASEVKAETAVEDIVPDVNIVRNISSKDQINMYRVVVDESGYQNFTFNFDAANKDKVNNGWTVKVYGENKEEIYKVTDIRTQFNSANFAVKKDKTVYISVEASNSLFMPLGVDYSLNFHTIASDEYESEGNSAFNTANEIKSGGAVVGSLLSKDDNDYYRLKINENGYAKLAFEIVNFDPATVKDGWTIEVYNKTKELVYRTTAVKKDIKLPELPFKKGQELFIRIGSYFTISAYSPETVEYKLSAEVKKSGGWEKEFNDSFSTATALSGKKYANLLWDKDVDYFKFKAAKTKKYKIVIDTGDNVDRSYQASIYINDKSSIKKEETFTSNKTFTLSLKKGQTVWVKVSGMIFNVPIGNKYSITLK